MNIIKFTITIVAPVGASNIYEMIKPRIKAIVETNKLDITTVLNFLNICIEVKVGKMIRLDIRSEPIIRIPMTIITEHKIENIMLYISVFIPIDLEKFSSNVIANILWYEIKYTMIIITNSNILIIKSLLSIDNMLPNR